MLLFSRISELSIISEFLDNFHLKFFLCIAKCFRRSFHFLFWIYFAGLKPSESDSILYLYKASFEEWSVVIENSGSFILSKNIYSEQFSF